MDKRIRASAIIFVDDKLITVYREKMVDGSLKKYYTIPGGGVEKGEDIIEGTKREIMEEIGIDVEVTSEYFYLEDEKSKQYFYMANYISGIIGSGEGPEFTSRDIEKYGLYEVRLIDKDEISRINLLPPQVKKYIIDNIK